MEALVFQSEKGQDVTTTRIVAKVFGKSHDNVLRDIQNLECSPEFSLLNFEESKYINDRGREYPMYLMSKDGFSFLVMGYTGGKAAEFKEKFINEFNKREALLKNDDFILSRALTILNERTKLLEAEVSKKEQQLELAENTIKQQAPKVAYCMEVLESHSDITTTVIAKELGTCAKVLNLKLKAMGIHYNQNGTWVLKAKYQDKGYTLSRTHTYTDSLGQKRTSILTTWTEKGRMFIHDLFKNFPSSPSKIAA